MSSRIKYESTKPFGRITARAVSNIIESKKLLSQLVDVLDAMAIGTPPTWDAVEAELEIPNGQGETFYNYVVGIKAKLAEVQGLPQLDQG